MRIIIVVGARPNFVKVGPLMPALSRAGIDARLVHTGQHYDAGMSDVFFADLAIPQPDWFLGVGSGTHAVQTGKAMIALEELFIAEKPDAVMVVGDVNSTLAGALAASKIGLPIVHLEAGLRSGDMSMPEEVNRLVTDQLASLLLTPTEGAGQNLRHEGVDEGRIEFVGNIVAESVLKALPLVERRDVAAREALESKSYIVATIHRPENTESPQSLSAIARALSEAQLPVLFPIHPRTRDRLEAFEIELGPNVTPLGPLSYLDMVVLERDAAACVTDSGGVQEEACVLGTPCVTVRRNTERQVTVEIGANQLVSPIVPEILAAVESATDSGRTWSAPERWDERVSERTVEALLRPIASR